MKVLTADNIAASVMDALTSNICVIDSSGVILAVNRAWVEFSVSNAGKVQSAYLGTNYLDICKNSRGPASEEAPDIRVGIQNVLQGGSNLFAIEYPCHSPDELRWFLARVTPLVTQDKAKKAKKIGAVVSHMNITDRKLLELDNARLASTDPLTGLPNRRFFEDYAKIEFQRLRRFGGVMSVLMLDLDKFKAINDRYGHPAGDAVLKKVTVRCKTAVRASDLFARIGGEEFVVLLPGTDRSGALLLAEKLRSIVEGLRIKTGAGILRVTSSIGVTTVTSKDRSIGTAIDRADKALYAAKNAGRNRVKLRLNDG